MIHDKIETVVAYPDVSKTEEGLMTKKWLAILLTAVLTVSMFPAAVWGDELPDAAAYWAPDEAELPDESSTEEKPVEEEGARDESAESQPVNGAIDISGAEITGLKAVYRSEYKNMAGGPNIEGVSVESFKPAAVLKVGGKTLKEDQDYTVHFSQSGPAQITFYFDGKGAYSGTAVTTKRYYVAHTIAGKNRYATNVEILKAGSFDYSRIVVVTGEDFPDALAANAYAGLRYSPLILTKRDEVPPAISGFLQDMKSQIKEVVIIGGKMDGAKKQLQKLLPEAAFKTIAGSNRYQTADMVTRQFLLERYMVSLEDKNTVVNCPVFVTTGESPADALSASSLSYHMGIPVLLVQGGTFNKKADTADVIKHFSRVYLLGDTKVVKDSVAPKGADVTRIGGKNRWETSRKIANYFKKEYGTNPGILTTYVPSDDDLFPDALAAGQFSYYGGNVIILVNQKHPDAYTSVSTEQYPGYPYWINFFVGSAGKDSGAAAIKGKIYKAVIKSIDKAIVKTPLYAM